MRKNEKLTNVVLCCYLYSNMADAVVTLIKIVENARLGAEAWRALNETLSSGSGEHNLVVGRPDAGDSLLHSEQICRGYGLSWVSHCYQYRGDSTITLVVAKDNWSDDTGGDPKIISGGPGHKHVKVKVTSRLFKGFDHTVLVYGKKRKKCNLM